jgi:hypothetical protein
MGEVVNLELPEGLARRARELAAATNRRLEEAVLDWIGQAVAEPAVGALSDEALLALCDARLDDARQEELSELLDQQREGALDEVASTSGWPTIGGAWS